MAASPRELWNNWSIQILVLFSLKLQIALFLFAGIRRRGAHYLVRLLLWLAYQLADYVPTYALGHLTISGAHPIVAFWAPFFLLHLGGPDNITAYSLEDSKLWKRHLLNAILQVVGALHVLYVHVARTQASLRLAYILMLVVGAVKYGEKTQALMRGNLDSIRRFARDWKEGPAMQGHFHPHDQVFMLGGELDDESLVRRAHSLFHICKRAIVHYQVIQDDSQGQDITDATAVGGVLRFWNLIENELSLMYDFLYTKASVSHTLTGYSVRLFSPLAILASLVLFRRSRKDAHSEEVADLVITYVLYCGALFMETTSLLNALGSSWTFAFLNTTRWTWIRYAVLCSGRWDRLRRLVVHLDHLARVGGGGRYTSRRWSSTIGQYNMLHFCTGSETALLGILARRVGLELKEWYNRGHYSWDTKMPDHVKNRIFQHMQNVYIEGDAVNSLGMFKNKWGQVPLVRNDLFQGILKDSLGVEFQECIIIWHIGTDVFLAKMDQDEESSLDVKAIKMISNYMMFLLVEQPDMLPGFSQDRLYQRTSEKLVKTRRSTHPRRTNAMSLCSKLKNLFLIKDNPGSKSRVTDREELAKAIYDKYESKVFSHDAPRLSYAVKLAKQLLIIDKNDKADSVKLVLDVWTDILVYASNKCSRKAHAEKLNSGGDLATIVWLMAEHSYPLYLQRRMRRHAG